MEFLTFALVFCTTLLTGSILYLVYKFSKMLDLADPKEPEQQEVKLDNLKEVADFYKPFVDETTPIENFYPDPKKELKIKLDEQDHITPYEN